MATEEKQSNRTELAEHYSDDDRHSQRDYRLTRQLMEVLTRERHLLIKEEMDAIRPLTNEEDVVGLRCLLVAISDNLKRYHEDRFKLTILVHLLRKLPIAMAFRFEASLEAEEELPNKKALLLLRHYLGSHLVDLYVRPPEDRRRLLLEPAERLHLQAIIQAEVTPLMAVSDRRDVAAMQPLLTVLAHARLLVRPYGSVEGAALESALFDAIWAKLPEEVRQLHMSSAVKLSAYGHKSLAPLNRTLTMLIREARLVDGATSEERLLRQLIACTVAERQLHQQHKRDEVSRSAWVTPTSKSTTTSDEQRIRCWSSSSSSSFTAPSFTGAHSSSPLVSRSEVDCPTAVSTPTSSPYSTAVCSSNESIHSASSSPLSASFPASPLFSFSPLSPSPRASSSSSASSSSTSPTFYNSELLLGGPLRHRYCSYCKTLGHHTFDCELPKAMLCFNCFELGHKAKYCTVQQLRVGNPYFENVFPSVNMRMPKTPRLPPPPPLSPQSSPGLVELPDGQLFGPRSGDLNFCLECVQFGHRAAECIRATCFSCHLTGHMSSHCPLRMKRDC